LDFLLSATGSVVVVLDGRVMVEGFEEEEAEERNGEFLA
jgi:hypothetical protein